MRMDPTGPNHWYAYKIYHNRINAIREQAIRDGLEWFIPMRTVERPGRQGIAYVEEPVVPSLIFIRSDANYVERMRRDPASHAGVYCHPGTTDAAVIDDREMEIFIYVLTTGCRRLDAVDEQLVRGDRVRITGGMFKGAEGYIVRIHGTKRFVVTIEGVAAIATTFIPRCFIEKIEPESGDKP